MELNDPGLFPAPAPRLSRELQAAVFGDLPSRLGHELDEPSTAVLVRSLLDCGWRPAQLAARVGGFPAAPDPSLGVRGLLRSLQDEPSPAKRAAAERAQRASHPAERPAAASPEAQARYLAQIRRDLGLAPRPRPTPPARRRPPCALCGAESGFFVTHQVRLCLACVQVLQSGEARLVAAG